jgi:hypothetical protein
MGYYFHTMLLDANACKKRTPKAEIDTNKLSIKPVGVSRKNHLEKRENNTIQ